METNNEWAVVVFLDDNCVANIPEKWILKQKNVSGELMGYWPPKSKNPTPLVKKREKPNTLNWPKYRIKILSRADDYEIAKRRCIIAEETSDCSAAEAEKRIKKINKKYPFFNKDNASDVDTDSVDDNDQDEDSDDDGKINSKNKKTKGRVNLEMPKISGNISILDECSSEYPGYQTQFEPDMQKLTATPSAMTSARAALMSEPKPTAYADILTFQRQILTKINTILARLSQLEERVDQGVVLLEQNQITAASNINQESIIGSSIEGKIAQLLPIENDNMLEQLELFLEDNNKIMAKDLSRIGGSTVEEITKKIMYRVLTNEIRELYSWEGGKGKRRFKLTKVSTVIFDAVSMNKRTAEACDDEIISNIKAWLVKAKERRCNAAKRVEKNIAAEKTSSGQFP